jgi:hypothetical protein
MRYGRRPFSMGYPAARQALIPPIHRNDIGVAHQAYTVRSQHRPVPASAIQHDRLLRIRQHRFNIPLNDALAEVNRPGRMVLRIFIIFADVDEMKPFGTIQPGLHVGDGTFVHTPPCLLHDP